MALGVQDRIDIIKAAEKMKEICRRITTCRECPLCLENGECMASKYVPIDWKVNDDTE